MLHSTLQPHSLKKPILVLFHAFCPDGFASAWVCHRKFGDRADYLPSAYGKLLPIDEYGKGKQIYMVDFSFPRAELLALKENNDVVVIDHHKTAQADLKDIPGVIFDMEKCGASLTWSTLFPDEEMPPLIAYVEDRDLWKWEMPYSREVSSAMYSYPQTFEDFSKLFERPIVDLVKEGEAIERYKAIAIAGNLKSGSKRQLRISDKTVIAKIVNCTHAISEVGEAAYLSDPDVDVAVLYFINQSGEVKVSFRSSQKKDFDCSELAKRFGGGGHKNAAGASMDREKFFQLFL